MTPPAGYSSFDGFPRRRTRVLWAGESYQKFEPAKQALFRSSQWSDWQWQVRNLIRTVADLEKWVPLSVEEKRAIQFSQGRTRFALTPYWASLMEPDHFLCPIRRQAIPLDDEFRTPAFEPADFAPPSVRAAGGRLIHAFADRAVLLLHSQCATVCRFCPQKKAQGVSPLDAPAAVTPEEWARIADYLRARPQIREVILSGGEPLLLNDGLLDHILSQLKGIAHLQTLRLETRALSVLPQRFTGALAEVLRRAQPLYLLAHVNHPRELTPEFESAVERLTNAGVPVIAQTTLLREINDQPEVLAGLFGALLRLRVRPYRLVQCLPASGAEHFRTSIAAGLRLVGQLRGALSGLAFPEYVVETPGGKIPLRTESVLARNKKRVLLQNHEGKVFVYPEKIYPLSS